MSHGEGKKNRIHYNTLEEIFANLKIHTVNVSGETACCQ